MTLADDIRAVVRRVEEENVPFMGASIAFYAIVSFIPLLVVALAVLTAVGAADTLIDALESSIPEGGSEVLDSVLSNTSGRGTASVVSLLVALWSGTKVFRGLTIAFDEIYGTGSDLSLLQELRKSLIVIAVLLVGFALLSATSAALAFVEFDVPYPTLVGNLVALVVLSLALLPLYYVLPPVSVTWSHALPGTVLTAIGWVLLQIAFFYYTRFAAGYAAYGFLGGVLLFVTFLYFAATILLVGAAANVALDDSYGRNSGVE